jgi:hypothetical protein|tara:strand:+ start:720 stop:1715 length:996 start_codon:yes stop_codon:yes gene_type:complete
MAYTDIDDPSAYFQTKLYTGTNNELVLTFDGNSDLQTDMIWTKNRSRASTNHVLSDTVRGIGKGLYPDLTNTEGDTNYVSAIGSDGYTIVATDSVEINRDDDTFVSWNWKEQAGVFDIVSYTGNATSGATISHNLGVVPTMMIVKCRSVDGTNWIVYTAATGNTHWQYLNATNAASANSAAWNNTSPTASVFSLGNDGDVNGDGRTYIAYLFGNKQGMSKVGSYIGNGNADGTFIYTGFKSAFLIVKNTTEAGNGWQIFDNKRDTFNVATSTLFSNLNNAEGTDTSFDVLSNGIKMKQGFGSKNKNANVYIYMAFAEQPLVTSTGVPATAR